MRRLSSMKSKKSSTKTLPWLVSKSCRREAFFLLSLQAVLRPTRTEPRISMFFSIIFYFLESLGFEGYGLLVRVVFFWIGGGLY